MIKPSYFKTAVRSTLQNGIHYCTHTHQAFIAAATLCKLESKQVPINNRSPKTFCLSHPYAKPHVINLSYLSLHTNVSYYTIIHYNGYHLVSLLCVIILLYLCTWRVFSVCTIIYWLGIAIYLAISTRYSLSNPSILISYLLFFQC